MTLTTLQKPLENYIEYWETLTVRSVRLIEKLAQPSLRFMDPLTQLQGVDDLETFLRHILKDKAAFKIRVTDHALGKDGHTAYLRWVLTYMSTQKSGKKTGQRTIRGMSEVMFSKQGTVMSHINHWDSASALLNHVPLAGWLNNKIINKILS